MISLSLRRLASWMWIACASSLAGARPMATVVAGPSLPTNEILVNGDFENVTMTGCLSNLSNTQVGVELPSLTAFGLAHEIDVYSGSACYGLPAVSGATKLAIVTTTAGSADAFSFGLTTPLVSGGQYRLEFWSLSVQQFSPFASVVDVGVSAGPTQFGTQIGSWTVPVPDVWVMHSVNFVAPIAASYLTVRSGTGGGWSHLDGFSLRESNVGTTFCLGDGSGSSCPCGNVSAAGLASGCANSLGTGGRLTAQGLASLAADSVVLVGDGMTDGPVVYLQGQQGISGSPFGDGLRCTTGALVRLRVRFNVLGASRDPVIGDSSIASQGSITSPGLRTYQAWYRDSAPFCQTTAFNLTNGWQILWTP